ncbi:MAG: hypothetical protein HYZ29_05870 [Myxococcales bacterium]|nr:hypothetical protein [Myxococcales bacterium]
MRPLTAVSVIFLLSATAAACSADPAATAGPSLGGSSGTGATGATGGSGGSSASGGSGGSSASGGSGGGIVIPDAGPPDQDTDQDGVLDKDEGSGDSDGDGKPNINDPINDNAPPAITFTAISTTFNSPIGIDYHEPTKSVVVSVNYPSGTPSGFERIEVDGKHQQFSNLTGLTEEVKIATARSGNPGGFVPGDLFVGNGVDGQIVRISGNGATVTNPWVDLPGENNGLMRGSLYVDRVGTFGGDLCVVTTAGEVWRITAAGVPTKIAAAGVHLEGALVVPDKPARFGPIAGKLIAGAEAQHLMYAFAPDGTSTSYTVGVDIEDIDYIGPKENFFGVNFGTSHLLGAAADQFKPMIGDVLLTTEFPAAGTSGLFRLKWDGAKLVGEPIPVGAGSATVGQWEHTTFAPTGIVEIPPPPA